MSSSKILKSVSFTKEVKHLSLRANEIETIYAELPDLESLDLSKNGIQKILIQKTNLSYLNLNSNELSEKMVFEILEGVSNPRLKILKIGTSNLLEPSFLVD